MISYGTSDQQFYIKKLSYSVWYNKHTSLNYSRLSVNVPCRASEIPIFFTKARLNPLYSNLLSKIGVSIIKNGMADLIANLISVNFLFTYATQKKNFSSYSVVPLVFPILYKTAANFLASESERLENCTDCIGLVISCYKLIKLDIKNTYKRKKINYNTLYFPKIQSYFHRI